VLAAVRISDVAQISAAQRALREIPVRRTFAGNHSGVDMSWVSARAGGKSHDAPAMDVRGGRSCNPRSSDRARDPGQSFSRRHRRRRLSRAKASLHAFGNLSYATMRRPLTRTTMYDIASLTKSSGTTTLVAEARGGDFPVPLDLDARVERYLPEWASGPQPEWRHPVTVRHLLTHTSGLPAFKEYWRPRQRANRTRSRKIFAEPLEYEPGTRKIYSDLGIILMARIIERLTGRTPRRADKTYIFTPLAMKDPCSAPPKKLWPWIAPTEIDNNLRHRSCRAKCITTKTRSPSAASPATPDSSALRPDLAAFCQMLLNGRCATRINRICGARPSRNSPTLPALPRVANPNACITAS